MPYLFQRALLQELLSEETRKERRNLLIVSGIGIAMVKANLTLERVSQVGIQISQINQRALQWILFALASYFLLIFIVYAMQDLARNTFYLREEAPKHQDVLAEQYGYRKFPLSGPTLEGGKKEPTYETIDLFLSKARSNLFSLYNQLFEIQRYINQLKTVETNEADTQLISDLEKKAKEIHDGLNEILQKDSANWNKLAMQDTMSVVKIFLIYIMRVSVDILIPLGGGIFAIITLFRGK